MIDRSSAKANTNSIESRLLWGVVIGRLRGVLSGECVEGRHVNDVSCVLRRKMGVVSRGARRFIGAVCVGEIAH